MCYSLILFSPDVWNCGSTGIHWWHGTRGPGCGTASEIPWYRQAFSGVLLPVTTPVIPTLSIYLLYYQPTGFIQTLLSVVVFLQAFFFVSTCTILSCNWQLAKLKQQCAHISGDFYATQIFTTHIFTLHVYAMEVQDTYFIGTCEVHAKNRDADIHTCKYVGWTV